MWSPIIERLKPLYEENHNYKEKLDKAIQQLCNAIVLCRKEGMLSEDIKDEILDKINFTHEDISRLEKKNYQESCTQKEMDLLLGKIEKIKAILDERS